MFFVLSFESLHINGFQAEMNRKLTERIHQDVSD